MLTVIKVKEKISKNQPLTNEEVIVYLLQQIIDELKEIKEK